jgi:hypothetical protein
MIVIALIWAVLTAVILVAWGRFHAAARNTDGVDETRYIHGLDEVSLEKAA